MQDDKKEEIREAADLVEVIGDYVRLKRSGSSFVGLCPFHDEKTPSFTVNPGLGIYKCFGCGASGDIFSFVMKMEGVGFPEALRTLAERYGISLPDRADPVEGQIQHEREGIYHALRFAGLFYYRQLREEEAAAQARNYLESRGYGSAIIRKFGLGYAPAGGEVLLQAAKREGIEEEYLIKADLIKPSRRGEGYYDTFRDRLMFPIFNPSGKVIAFAGRVLGEKKEAKYINSSQTPVYNKSEVVYGVNFSKNGIRKEEEVILVEGYTDVITLHQFGIENVAASSGTALTVGQLRILKRYGNRIVMIYDADAAGQSAMKRGMNLALAEGMEVHLLELPDKEDPDSFVRTFGKESFRELKKGEARDVVTFTVEQAERIGELETPGGRTRLVASILESIAEIPDPLARQVYVQHLHQKTQHFRNSSDRELFSELDKLLKQKRQPKKTFSTPRAENPPPFEPSRGEIEQATELHQESPPKPRRPDYEKELIRLMIQYGKEMIDYVGRLCNEQLFEDDELRYFYQDLISRHQKGEETGLDHYLHREPPFPGLTGDVMLEQYVASDRHRERTGTEFKRDKDPFRSAKSSIKPLRLHYLKRHLASIAEQTKQADEEQKRALIRKQKRTQREISHMEQTSADQLFPDPPGREKGESGKTVFEYKMKQQNR